MGSCAKANLLSMTLMSEWNVANRRETIVNEYKAPIPLNESQQAQLWSQRLFEAEAGLNKFIVEQKGGKFFYVWLQVKKEIFMNVPVMPKADLWKGAFFYAQALMEKFVINQFGYEALEQWAKANAVVHGLVERPRAPGVLGPLERFRQQLELYGSSIELLEPSVDEAELIVRRCGIWDYRESARLRGVVITLKSPCEYCTAATSANIEVKGFKPNFQLMAKDGVNGCRWSVRMLSV